MNEPQEPLPKPPKYRLDEKELRRLARRYQKGTVFTAFDTETTGLKADAGRVIEIGAVKFSKDGVLGTFQTFLNPGIPIPEGITDLTGITTEMVSAAPEFREIARDFLAFIKGTRLVAHNCNFDVRFINYELFRAGLPLLKSPELPAIDTVQLARIAFPGQPTYSQPPLAAALGIPIERAHRADDDARVCSEIFKMCVEKSVSAQSAVANLAARALSGESL